MIEARRVQPVRPVKAPRQIPGCRRALPVRVTRQPRGVLFIASMSHAPSTKRPPEAPLYKQDLHAWAKEQVRLLQEGRLDQIDAENIAAEQRRRILRQLRRSPSLKAELDEAVREGYASARLLASSETDLDLDEFPETCPYDWDAVLNRMVKY